MVRSTAASSLCCAGTAPSSMTSERRERKITKSPFRSILHAEQLVAARSAALDSKRTTTNTFLRIATF
jgi:hypothetical protein